MDVEPKLCDCGTRYFPAKAGQAACLDCLTEDDPAGQPTLEEIAYRCEEIRRGWSAEERRKRRRLEESD